jgi:hypothetical protein
MTWLFQVLDPVYPQLSCGTSIPTFQTYSNYSRPHLWKDRIFDVDWWAWGESSVMCSFYKGSLRCQERAGSKLQRWFWMETWLTLKLLESLPQSTTFRINLEIFLTHIQRRQLEEELNLYPHFYLRGISLLI